MIKGYEGAGSVDLEFRLVNIDDTEIYDFAFIKDTVIDNITKAIVASSDPNRYFIKEGFIYFNERKLSFNRYF